MRDGTELFRTRYVWWVFAAFNGFIVLLTAGTALNPSAPALGRVACDIIAVTIVTFMVRARRAGIEISPDRILVRRYSGLNASARWDEVDCFRLVSNGNGFNRGA
jgi:hypothetical protein